MSGVEYEVIGDTRLKATMHGAAREIGDINLTSVAAEVARDAAGRAPRLTGALAGSIRPSWNVGAIATVRSDLPYAGRTEYGWPKVGQSARPFMRPALIANTDTALKEADKQAERALSHVKGA